MSLSVNILLYRAFKNVPLSALLFKALMTSSSVEVGFSNSCHSRFCGDNPVSSLILTVNFFINLGRSSNELPYQIIEVWFSFLKKVDKDYDILYRPQGPWFRQLSLKRNVCFRVLVEIKFHLLQG